MLFQYKIFIGCCLNRWLWQASTHLLVRLTHWFFCSDTFLNLHVTRRAVTPEKYCETRGVAYIPLSHFPLFSLILSGRPPSQPARHSVGSSSLSSFHWLAAGGQTGSHHHIKPTNQAWTNSKKGLQLLELNQMFCKRITISYCVYDDLRLQIPPQLEQGAG